MEDKILAIMIHVFFVFLNSLRYILGVPMDKGGLRRIYLWFVLFLFVVFFFTVMVAVKVFEKQSKAR